MRVYSLTNIYITNKKPNMWSIIETLLTVVYIFIAVLAITALGFISAHGCWSHLLAH